MQRALDILSALADPTRLKIMLLLRDIELAMGELADILGQSQPRVSRHVRILAEAGLVRRQKEGAWVFVSLGANVAFEPLYALIDALLVGKETITVELQRLSAVRQLRQKAADQWFADNAAEWDHMRQLQGADTEVDAAILAAVKAGRVGRFLDVGTGTGRMLERIAPLADSSIGIDRSPDMLRMARATLDAAGSPSAGVRQADMGALPFESGTFDTLLMNHVLHFADDPAAIIAEAARVVAAGGRLLVVDFASHEQEELRTRFRHIRLGFESESILRWMSAAGLSGREVGSFAGPSLTVKLWEGTRS
ncbi:ArsR/SmtB family transcription factor [Sandaracinobacteroides saxicola]|uniref:Metalloregulator ArsR/SmtB family transcription factor n=1 Tax=Sandaracinobacteroides saxicola TaxID=2759707 RepID=A0A7G5ILV6_9SPHN|nr:metalloregulator ArsR/SmtB family transcription factor [Sandaracinobacteroides saxicola]QMW24348.1 metalloregulator ArsR/SmtB family transcription factor [Sandaracinobacteroides saxicola]